MSDNKPQKRPELRALLPFATESQKRIIEAIELAGSNRKAAKHLGCALSSVTGALARLRKHAARQGWSPEHGMVHTAPDGFMVKGTTTLHHAEKGQLLQWVKTTQDTERQAQIIRETVAAWCEDARGLAKPTKPPKQSNDDLITLYPMGDPHFGMYAWAAEVGENFDLDIAEQDLCAAVDYLVGQAPASERGVLVNLGDFFHYDNMDGVTARSGHALDTDGRMQKMIDVGVRALRRCIGRMLEKHKTVEIVNAPGNHDNVLALAMNVLFRNVYENEPRVIVHDAPTMRHYVEHGKCLIGVVHGHQTKDNDLPGIMATEQAEAWGRTKYRYYWRGHHHHDNRKDYNGCTVEQFRTLAAGDAYAVGAGYLSGRDMKGIVMHKDHGETARFTCSIDLLRAA